MGYLKYFICLLLFSLSLETYANSLTPSVLLTPEDVRFAQARCQNDSDVASNVLKSKWAQRIYPDDHETHCYVKCFLSKLGLIDLISRGLAAHKLLEHWDNIETEFNEDCLEEANIEEPLDGTCLSYYNKWTFLSANCEELVQLLLFDADTAVAYKYSTRSKEPGETATEFCHTQATDELDNVGAEVTANIEDSFVTSYKCQLECIFRHFRYFDAYGRLDETEIKQSFMEANVLTTENSAIIQKCMHRANLNYYLGYCDMAFELQSCLQKMSKDFQTVYRMRDKITKNF